ncbi:hypothetical protein EYF80_059055 [Liparis tanakae]|uniref:Uncharacterized protein n=1 Tax=Liparis tanakae TaxID=230148 RepID=A0A4Z2EPR5_9TELE|nr:hypothetical protein EYF80_059055 [Liparis tanakae]
MQTRGRTDKTSRDNSSLSGAARAHSCSRHGVVHVVRIIFTTAKGCALPDLKSAIQPGLSVFRLHHNKLTGNEPQHSTVTVTITAVGEEAETPRLHQHPDGPSASRPRRSRGCGSSSEASRGHVSLNTLQEVEVVVVKVVVTSGGVVLVRSQTQLLWPIYPFRSTRGCGGGLEEFEREEEEGECGFVLSRCIVGKACMNTCPASCGHKWTEEDRAAAMQLSAKLTMHHCEVYRWSESSGPQPMGQTPSRGSPATAEGPWDD